MKFRFFVRSALTLCVLALLTTIAYATEIPKLIGHVNDYAGLMTKEQVATLEQTLTELEKQTTAQVAILTIKNLDGEDLEKYSIGVASTWKLGQKDADNGLLILYTVQEDKYRIEVGYGLEGGIPDGKAGDIIRQNLRAHADPSKGTHDFFAGFSAAVKSVSEIITTEYTKDPTGKSLAGNNADEKLVIAFILIVIVANLAGSIFGATAGAIVGSIIGLCGAWLLGFMVLGYIICAVVGFFFGLIGNTISVVDIGLGMASGGSGGGFSGGGGGFGGGGASG